jgi:tyrosine aminotransferase
MPSAVDMTTKLVTLKRNNAAIINREGLLSKSGQDFLAQRIKAESRVTERVWRASRPSWGKISTSTHALETVNPIRKIVDVMSISPNPDKNLIKLHLGDPTITGILNPHESTCAALEESLKSGLYNGYGPATGLPCVREAVASHATTPEAPVTADDIVLASGCSHALQLAIEALANPGDNILVPKPGFPLYATLMRPHAIEDRAYNLVPENNWEADLAQLESLIDGRTKAIIVNNPSNPCGAVFSRQHLEAILRLADTYKIPIIADEIYGDMTYGGAEFIPMARLEPKVPILSCDGLAKRWLVPGWRLGWVIVHDHQDAFSDVRQGLRQLATKIVGPCAVIQGAVPKILKATPESFFDRTRAILEANAKVAMEVLGRSLGIEPVQPSGAMYLMVRLNLARFPAFESELEFTRRLIAEESVYCLPGTAFHYPGAVRFVLTFPEEVTREACERLEQFCARHFVAPTEVKSEKMYCEMELRKHELASSLSPSDSASSAEYDEEMAEVENEIFSQD